VCSRLPVRPLFALVGRVCEYRWVEPQTQDTTPDAHSNVSSHLSLGLLRKPEGLGFTQCSVHHTHLALTTQRIDDSLLRSLLRMLWSPSSFEGEGKRSMHETSHQFQQHSLYSLSAAYAAHCAFNRLSRCSMRRNRRFAPRVPFFCKRLRKRA